MLSIPFEIKFYFYGYLLKYNLKVNKHVGVASSDNQARQVSGLI